MKGTGERWKHACIPNAGLRDEGIGPRREAGRYYKCWADVELRCRELGQGWKLAGAPKLG